MLRTTRTTLRTLLGLCLALWACSSRKLPVARPPSQAAPEAMHPPEHGEPDADATSPVQSARPSVPAIVRLAVPPFTGQPMNAPGLEVGPFVPMRLIEVERRKNQITDVDAWFANHHLEPIARELDQARRAELAALGVPSAIEGLEASRELVHTDHTIVLYDAPEQRGRYLVVARAGQLKGPFDFQAYREPPQKEGAFTAMETRWAQALGETLFVSHAHRTYAKSSGGHNAYVSALSLADGTLHWRSQPLVSNAEECGLFEGNLVCGYGFTAEPDFLYVLEARTGQVRQKVKLMSGPEHILLRGDQVFVRAYDTDYVFELRRE